MISEETHCNELITYKYILFFEDLIDYQLKIFTLLVLYDFYINIAYNFM